MLLARVLSFDPALNAYVGNDKKLDRNCEQLDRNFQAAYQGAHELQLRRQQLHLVSISLHEFL
jgi:hypothetical protein